MKTSDLFDSFADKVKVSAPIGFKDYGGMKIFSGKIYTVKCFEDNTIVRKSLEQNGKGKVLVIDGGGSLRCALMGDMIGELAVKNEWNGVIVYGCIRDSERLSDLKLGIKALNTNPAKSGKRNEGQENIPVSFAGIMFTPGEYVYCDKDGIIVCVENLES